MHLLIILLRNILNIIKLASILNISNSLLFINQENHTPVYIKSNLRRRHIELNFLRISIDFVIVLQKIK